MILPHTATSLILQCWPGVLIDVRCTIVCDPPRITYIRFHHLDICRPDGEVLLSASVEGEDHVDSVVLREIRAQLERDLELREAIQEHAS